MGISTIIRKLRPSFNAMKSAIRRERKRKVFYLRLSGVSIANRIYDRDVAEIEIKTGESGIINYLRMVR